MWNDCYVLSVLPFMCLSFTVISASVFLKPSVQRCPSNTEYASSLERISIRLDQSLED